MSSRLSQAEWVAANPPGTPVELAVDRATATAQLRDAAAETLVAACYISQRKRTDERVA
jgi:hypothetical protein